jgi:hypothetical protein
MSAETTRRQLTSADAEKIWRNEFNRHCNDQSVTVFNLFLALSLELRTCLQTKTVSRYDALHFLIEISAFIFIRRLYRHAYGRTYLNWRTTVVCCTRALRGMLMIAYLMIPPHDETTFPLFTSTKFSWTANVVWAVFTRSSIPLTQSFGYRLPLNLQIPVVSIVTFILVGLSIPRCAVECTKNASFYSVLYSKTMSMFSELKKLVIPMS